MAYPVFRNKWLGKRVDADGAYAYQCVDLIKQYTLEEFGIQQGAWGNAADYWEKTHPTLLTKFDRISTRDIKQGDILIFKRSAANGNAGHIAVADSATQMLEQNGGAGSGTGTGSDAIRITNIPFNNLLGVLRPKGGNQVWLDKAVVDDYEKHKKVSMALMDTVAGKTINYDPNMVRVVIDDYEKNKQANQDAQKFKKFVAVDNAGVWESVGGDLNQLSIVNKQSSGAVSRDAVITYINNNLK